MHVEAEKLLRELAGNEPNKSDWYDRVSALVAEIDGTIAHRVSLGSISIVPPQTKEYSL